MSRKYIYLPKLKIGGIYRQEIFLSNIFNKKQTPTGCLPWGFIDYFEGRILS
jgi:hypothetical protein